MGCGTSKIKENNYEQQNNIEHRNRNLNENIAIENNYHENDLIENDFSELKKFTFGGIITKCKIVDIYDGDTVTIVFYYNDIPIKDSFRMYGYDSPEMKPSKTLTNRDLHINAAKKCKKILEDMILNKILWVKFLEEEKYGRLMGYLYFKEPINDNIESINDYMIKNGLGKSYLGGQKSDFNVEEIKNILLHK
jgi:endonuclease YncB( thermonuclease family)